MKILISSFFIALFFVCAIVGLKVVNAQTVASDVSHVPVCNTLWWFNSITATPQTSCYQQQFCGSYMYLGLKTFTTQAACQAALPSSATSSFPALTIATGSLPVGAVGAPYNFSISASGGSGSYPLYATSSSGGGKGGSISYLWSATGLPDGLSISNGTCIFNSGFAEKPCPDPAFISGTPTTAGTYTVTVQSQSGSQTASNHARVPHSSEWG